MSYTARDRPSRRDGRRPPAILECGFLLQRLDDYFRPNRSAQCSACNRPARHITSVVPIAAKTYAYRRRPVRSFPVIRRLRRPQRMTGSLWLPIMNTFIRQEWQKGKKQWNKVKKIKKYNINSYVKQSTLSWSYTALTAANRGPNTQRRQSSAE